MVAPLAGIAVLLTRMIGRSGRPDLAIGTLRRKKGDCALIVVYDLTGAVLAVAGVVLLGVTKPTLIVSYFDSQPLIAWAIFGALGPIFAIGIVDRFPVERLVQLPGAGNGRNQIEVTAARGAALRRRAAERILAGHYDDVAVSVGSERRQLLHLCKDLINSGDLHFDDIAGQITAYAHELDDGRLPREVSVILENRTAWPTDHDTFEAALTLVGIALDQGLIRPVSIACRIVDKAARPGPQPAS